MATDDDRKAIDTYIEALREEEGTRVTLSTAQEAHRVASARVQEARKALPKVGPNIPRRVFTLKDGRVLFLSHSAMGPLVEVLDEDGQAKL